MARCLLVMSFCVLGVGGVVVLLVGSRLIVVFVVVGRVGYVSGIRGAVSVDFWYWSLWCWWCWWCWCVVGVFVVSGFWF